MLSIRSHAYKLLKGTRFTCRSIGARNGFASQASDPLRILFCGSDEFSAASLRALHHELNAGSALIKSIDVVCKEGKPYGQGLKKIRQVPLAAVARELSLPLHEIPTFQGWECPRPENEPVNLIIAVSFGLFVPPRILNGAKYGGLNVHPSLLPDFRGAAPLHHTLLTGCTKTGITLQTLDLHHFDRGTILLQTPQPGFDIPNPSSITVPELTRLTADRGAELLIQALRDNIYVPPLQPLDPQHPTESSIPPRPAPKITPEDRHINWQTWTADDILRRSRVLGPLWSNAKTGPAQDARRIKWSSGLQLGWEGQMDGFEPGMAIANRRNIFIRTVDQKCLRADRVTVEGLKEDGAGFSAIKTKMVAELRSDNEWRLWGPFT